MVPIYELLMTAISSMVVIAIRTVNLVGCNNNIRIHIQLINISLSFY